MSDQAIPTFPGFVIRDRTAARWRTMDSLGMPDWTDDITKALCTTLRQHAELYAQDDAADVEVVPVVIDGSPGAAYRRGVQDGGSAVFNAVMGHESNAGRGMDLYRTLQGVAADALAASVIVKDPDEQPLWQHLIDEAYADFRARLEGAGPFTQVAMEPKVFALAVRGMLAKKLPAPDSENMQLREALCQVVQLVGLGSKQPTAPLKDLLAITDAVRKDMERRSRGYKTLGDVIQNMTVANQSAWIEWRHGKGAEAAMAWIHNGLLGPGFIPSEDAPYGKEAQAWFDANNANPLPQCACGRPSNIGWMDKGFCSEAHYRQAKAAHAAAAQEASGG